MNGAGPLAGDSLTDHPLIHQNGYLRQDAEVLASRLTLGLMSATTGKEIDSLLAPLCRAAIILNQIEMIDEAFPSDDTIRIIAAPVDPARIVHVVKVHLSRRFLFNLLAVFVDHPDDMDFDRPNQWARRLDSTRAINNRKRKTPWLIFTCRLLPFVVKIRIDILNLALYCFHLSPEDKLVLVTPPTVHYFL